MKDAGDSDIFSLGKMLVTRRETKKYKKIGHWGFFFSYLNFNSALKPFLDLVWATINLECVEVTSDFSGVLCPERQGLGVSHLIDITSHYMAGYLLLVLFFN